MPFKHKLARRLAMSYFTVASLLAIGCADAPTTQPADVVPARAADADPALAVSTSSAVGQRVRTDRQVPIFQTASRRSPMIGAQSGGATGVVLEGPTAITYAEPYALFRVNFDSGVDGWVYGLYLSLLAPIPAPPPPPPAPAPVASVAVTPTSAALTIGGTTTATATLRDSAGNVLTGRTIAWTSSSGTVASVSASGTITALLAGSASVTATSEGRSASVAVSVTAPVISVATVTVAPSAANLVVGQSQQVTATLRDLAGNILTGRAISWSSSAPAVASVSTSGAISAVAAGNATITATSEGRTATVAVVVAAPVINVASVSLSPASATLSVGASAQLVATVRDSANNVLTGRTISWSSSNAGIASVASNGTVSAVAAGSATITASTGGRSGTATITVQAPPPPPPSQNVIFQSRWSTALGNTQNAFLDASNTKPWVFACCGGATTTSITTPAALGLQKWPAGNVYAVGAVAGLNYIPTHQLVADLGVPAAGSHRYFRYYLQVTYGDDHGTSGEGNLEHGVENSPAPTGGGRGMTFYRLPRNDGTWFPAYREVYSGWRYVAPDLRLRKNQTYRMEWHLAYGATTYTVQVRIYDADGVLVATENDFFMTLPTRNTSTRLGAAQFQYNPLDHRYMRVGSNGPTSNFPMANMRNENIFLHGAVAVCTTGWCGPVAP